MYILFRWVFVAVSVLAAAYFIPGIFVASFYTALVVAALWGVANLVIKPVLVLLTLPINLLTLGLFTFVINAFLFWFLSTIVKGFDVAGFVPAFFGALLVSIFGYIGNKVFWKD